MVMNHNTPTWSTACCTHTHVVVVVECLRLTPMVVEQSKGLVTRREGREG